MRTEIVFKLVCAVCGDQLEADHNRSNIAAHNAGNAESNMAIVPCKQCMNKAKEPARLIAKALRLIDEQ